MSEPLHVKYRPTRFEHVVGQDGVMESIMSLFSKKGEERMPHAFLFIGPSGVGKTTLARLIAAELGARDNGIIEIDAATNSGIDDMRAVTGTLQYHSFGPTPTKMVILDECQALSDKAWQSLLKIIEEPPDHVYFAFCTTHSAKVPKTVKTRCHSYVLSEVPTKDLADLIEDVAEHQRIKLPGGASTIIARASEGSPRQALVYLSMCAGASNLEMVHDILSEPAEQGEAVELARLLVSGRGNWREAVRILEKLKEQNPESTRIMINRYSTAVVLKSTNKPNMAALATLEAFSSPTYDMGALVLAVADVIVER